MTNDLPLQVTVSEEAIRHLARNVPHDFAAYCDQIRKRQSRNFPISSQRDRQGIPQSLREIVKACVEEVPDDYDASELCEELLDVAIRYEALLVSVDYTISPDAVYRELARLKRNLSVAQSRLMDAVRDESVLEQKGLLDVGDLEIGRDAFDRAGSLAEKATIASQFVVRAEAELDHMREHFHYKSALAKPGKPPLYAFAYAVFALADIFERVNRKGHVVNVSELSHLRERETPEDSLYASPFLDFVEAFFRRFNPAQIASHGGGGFANAVRKVTQVRKKSSDLHVQLHGQATAQEVINFMNGFDLIRR